MNNKTIVKQGQIKMTQLNKVMNLFKRHERKGLIKNLEFDVTIHENLVKMKTKDLYVDKAYCDFIVRYNPI